MRRGSTSSMTFTLPFVLESPKALTVVFSQFKYLILQKKLGEFSLTVDPVNKVSTIELDLSQWETLLFHKGYANVQVRVVFDSGQAFTSDTAVFEVEESLTNEVLGDGED